MLPAADFQKIHMLIVDILDLVEMLLITLKNENLKVIFEQGIMYIPTISLMVNL